ncbi:hypothetical protein P8881_19690 [Bacillus haynesii]|nr:hypothetical protein [Bacillus haynesii]MEC0736871.1 hypothetical protein [Bacillus haynesii]
MKNKLIKCGSLFLFLLILVCILQPFSYLNENRIESKDKGNIETFGVNDEGYLEIGGETLYMSVKGKRVPATLKGLFKEGDGNQELLTKSDLDSKSGSNGFISTVVSFIKPQVAKASSVKIEYKGIVSYGGNIVGDFRVNGEQAFCFQHSKPTPPTGASYEKEIPYNNARVQRALYYGWGGEGNIFKNKSEGIVTTSLILDRIYSGGSTGKSLPHYDKLWNLVVNGKDLDNGIDFSDKNLSVSVKGTKQVSQTTQLNTSKNNSVRIKVPKGVTIVNESTGKKVTNGEMRVFGGQKVHLEAGLDVGLSYSTGNLKSDAKLYQPLITKPQGGGYQVLGFIKVYDDPNNTTSFKAEFKVRQSKITVQHIDRYTNKVLEKEEYKRTIGSKYSFHPKDSIKQGDNKFVPENHKSQSGTLGNKDITIKFYYNLQREVTIKHIDHRDQRLIKQEKHIFIRGDKYSFGPRKDLKKGKYTYRPLSEKKKEGTIGTKNLTFTFYYDVPLIKAGLDRVRIYTDQASKGLPVKVNLVKENIYPDTVNDMTKEKITLSIYDGKTKVASKEYTAKDLPKNANLKIPSKYLETNEKRAYIVKLESFDKNAFDIPKDRLSIEIDGYTSSEKTIKVDAAKSKELKYKGVVMTEREVGKDMKLFNESLNIPLRSLSKMRTGYGFEMPVNFSYSNDIGTWSEDFGVDMLVSTEIVDNSYIEYPVQKNIATVSLEKTSSTKTKYDESVSIKSLYELQHINVEKRTGHLFSDEQVKNKDKRIKYDLVNGNRKFYLPIWGHVGEYPLKVESNGPIGVNQVKFVINHELNVFAHMIAHMDSETLKDDAILIKPVNSDDPFPKGLPEGWTETDVNWIKK